MEYKKTIFLFLAFVLPICIFIFLKFFGKNEFAVKPLYVDAFPEFAEGCEAVGTLPYHIPDSINVQLPFLTDSLVIISFAEMHGEAANQMKRVMEEIIHDKVEVLSMPASDRALFWKSCIFFLKDPANVVLVDRKGSIRGQYVASDREEIDRLLTELTIILKKY